MRYGSLPVLILLALPVAGQRDTVTYPDPAPDRGIIAATARHLPDGQLNATGYGVVLLPALAIGYGGRTTVTFGTSPVTFLAGLANLYGSVKVSLVDRPNGAASLGTFYVFAAFEGVAATSVWPYLSVTAGGDPANITLNIGKGFGEALWSRRDQGAGVAWQMTASARIGRAARLIAEWMRDSERDRLFLIGVRLWRQGYFIELGGGRTYPQSPDASTWFPMVNAGITIR